MLAANMVVFCVLLKVSCSVGMHVHCLHVEARRRGIVCVLSRRVQWLVGGWGAGGPSVKTL